MSSITFYQILFQDKLLYIGSTRDLYARYREHKHHFKVEISNTYLKFKEYSKNFEDFDFQEICTEICATKEEQLKRERFFIERDKPLCNQHRPIITNEERQENMKKIYQNRRKKIYECSVCGGKYHDAHKIQHLNTIKHKTAMIIVSELSSND